MKKSYFLLLFILVLQSAFGQNVLQFKISKPYCIFNFLEVAGSNTHEISWTLKKYIDDNIPADDTTFKQIISQFKTIQLDYSYQLKEIPESRHQNRSTYDLIVAAAVDADNLKEFKEKTIGILPNSSQQKLFELLNLSEPYYDRLIWNKYQSAAVRQINALRKYQPEANTIFNDFKHFYNSTWSQDVPFIVSIFPIPGTKGNTFATPHFNTLCVGLLTGDTNYISSVSIALHEMCHTLYDEQSPKFQQQLDSYFSNDTSIYKTAAYTYFNEGLATACGNGWAYKYLSSKLDTGEWYHHDYVNGFAHVLYPLVDDYIRQNETIDSSFVTQSVALFAKQFPKSIYDYGLMFRKLTIYTDGTPESSNMVSNIGKYYWMGYANVLSPIEDSSNLDNIIKSTGTQLIILNNSDSSSIEKLQQIFPRLKSDGNLTVNGNYLLSFYDNKHRPIIIIKAKSVDSFGKILQQMKSDKYMNPSQALHLTE
jgi:hypothetical protein